ncbi:hypothetical protein ScPMuIL_002345 [Solemya velum]
MKPICLSQEDYKKKKIELKGYLQKREYQRSAMDSQLQKGDELDRRKLLRYNQPAESDHEPLVLTYNDALPSLHKIVHRNMKRLHQSDRLRHVFPKRGEGDRHTDKTQD